MNIFSKYKKGSGFNPKDWDNIKQEKMKRLVRKDWIDKGCVQTVTPHKSGYRFSFAKGEDVVAYGNLIILVYEIGLFDCCITSNAFLDIAGLLK